MGTRFLSARETNAHPGYRELVLKAKDGAQSTTRSKLFDNVKGPNIWPDAYDGRSLVTQSYEDYASGVDIAQVRDRHNAAVAGEDAGYGSTTRANVWAGASVGLVNKVQDAAEIVHEVRAGIGQILKTAIARL
jgi:nitronate monooxygenase